MEKDNHNAMCRFCKKKIKRDLFLICEECKKKINCGECRKKMRI